MNRDSLRVWLNALAVVATIVVNALANALPINGLNTGEISDRFEVYFVPAGYVFSIWGLIYLGLIAYAVYQALPSQRDNPRLRGVGYLVPLSCAANIAWIFLWHYEAFLWTLPAMFALLILLIAVYLRLGTGRNEVPDGERWTVQAPFSLYLGWITVATVANVTAVLDYVGWGGWGLSPELWMVVMLLVTLALASAMSLTRGDVAYMLVLIWALVGIAVKFPGAPLVSAAAWAVAALVAVVMVVGAFVQSGREPELRAPA